MQEEPAHTMFRVDERNITNITNILETPGYSLTDTTWPILLSYNILVVVFGVGGNSAVLYLSLVHNALKLDPVCLMFVHHLAVSDILVSLLMFLPMSVTLAAKRWVLGHGLCFVTAFLFSVPVIYEGLTILSISVYRITSILSKIKNEVKLKAIFRYVLLFQLLLSSWPPLYLILADCYAYFDPKILMCWPSQAIQPGTPQDVIAYYGIVILAVPIIITAVLSVATAVIVRIKTGRVRTGRTNSRMRGMKKMLLTLSLVVHVFLLSYSGIILNLVLGTVSSFKIQQSHWFDLLMIYLNTLNVILNPFIYVLTNKNFRNYIFSLGNRIQLYRVKSCDCFMFSGRNLQRKRVQNG